MTAHLPASAARSLVTWRNDPLRVTFGGRIMPEDAVLATRGGARGLALYRDLHRDAEVNASLQKREAMIISRRWEIRPGADTPAGHAAAEFCRSALRRISIERIAKSLLDAIVMGVSIVELVWANRPEGVVPVAAKHRDPQRFTFRDAQPEPQLRLLTVEEPLDGIALPERKFIVHRYEDPNGNPWGLGLGPVLFWPALFKRHGLAFALGAIEKIGQPTAIGIYPPGTPEDDQRKLLRALQVIGTEAGIILPEGMRIVLLEAVRDDVVANHLRFVRYMDDQIATIICGSTLASVRHVRTLRELAAADARLLGATLSDTLLRWIVELNTPGAPVPRIVWNMADPHDLRKRAEIDSILHSIGIQLTEEGFRERYGEGYRRVDREPHQ